VKRPFTRLLSIGDMHCGHEFGLTPPAWQYKIDGHPRIAKAAKFQRALWGFALEAIEPLLPIDILEVGGDCIEGKGEKSGGIELITTDRLEQGEMAAEFINFIDAKKVRIHYGTRYHVGKDEDFEQAIVDKVNCKDTKIQGHGFFGVNGRIIDVKHKVGSSGIPHGRTGPLAKARLWNTQWNLAHKRQPLADIMLRHHVHYYSFAGGPGWLGITVPPLCYGSAFGIRECDGVVDVGMIVIDIYKNGEYIWRPILAEFPELKANVESL
jgi:hypothetical protein